MAVLREGGHSVEWLGSEAIAARFPMLSYPTHWGAVLDPNAGILVAHRCLNAVQSRFLALGGRIVTGRVESIESRVSGGVRVETRSNENGKIEVQSFDRTVVCAGPWTAKLIPQLGGLLHCLRTPVTCWRDPTGSDSASGGFPLLFNARLTGIYGLPSYEYHGLVKMLFHGGPEADPDARDLTSCKPHIKKVRHYVREHLKLLECRQPAILEACMYTMTPDSDPIIDRITANVVVACGFSGSGFKHSPATGWLLAALALGQEESIPEGFRSDRYALDRFQKNKL